MAMPVWRAISSLDSGTYQHIAVYVMLLCYGIALRDSLQCVGVRFVVGIKFYLGKLCMRFRVPCKILGVSYVFFFKIEMLICRPCIVFSASTTKRGGSRQV